MAGIGEASAILGVAQLGLQLASALITIIADYRDAATNINRLRDEIHLTSIAVQQLGHLAAENRLLPGRGILEATHLRERCRSVIWEIRTVVKRRGDGVLRVDEVRGEEIDVGYFTAWKWALWTRRQLEGPRGELDRLKGSLTLVFVTHMAILGAEGERDRYRRQIPGCKRSVDWAEEKYRGDGVGDEVDVPVEVLDVGPAEWQQFLQWRAGQQTKNEETESNRGGQEQVDANQSPPPETPAVPDRPPTNVTRYECRSLDPMAGQTCLIVSRYSEQDREQLLRTWSKLDVWYRKQIDEIVNDLNSELTSVWFVVGLKVVHQPLLRRLERPPSVQVFLRGDPRPITLVKETMRIGMPQTRMGAPEVEAIPYTDSVPIDMPVDEDAEEKHSDEEIIDKQLALYHQQE